MKKLFKLLSITFFLILSFGFTYQTNQSGDLYLKLDNIRNSNGVFYIFLYTFENQYPHEPYTYYKVTKSKVSNGKLTVKIEDIEFRKYAISLIDDENDNEDLDRFLGLPTEGFGFSNDLAPVFSLPDYKELIFSFLNEKSINIQVQYFL